MAVHAPHRSVVALLKTLTPEHSQGVVFLRRQFCCARCILRLLQIRDTDVYRQPLTAIMEAFDEAIKRDIPDLELNFATRPENTMCPLCLGMLELVEQDSFRAEFCQLLKSSGYTFIDFRLEAVSVRVSFLYSYVLLQLTPCDSISEIKLFKKGPAHDDVVDVKEAFRWVIGAITFMRMAVDCKFYSKFNVHMKVTHDETQREFAPLVPAGMNIVIEGSDDEAPMEEEEEAGSKKPAKKKRKPNQPPQQDGAVPNSVASISGRLSELSTKLLDIIPGTPPPVTSNIQYALSYVHLPLYLCGRYVKFVRDYSQSPWFVGEGRVGAGSVQETIVGAVEPLFKADELRFTSSGREDIDVRMLGRGRPFIVEVVNPHYTRFSKDKLTEMQNSINSVVPDKVQVLDLQFCTKKQADFLKKTVEEKRKSYRLVAWFPNPITEDDLKNVDGKTNVVLEQRTPIRVLHRRSNAIRKKTLFSIKCQYVDPHYVIVDLVTQAGTYVKEFIHGDLGRTSPSFAQLLGREFEEVDILALDVMGVELDFPRILDANFKPADGAPSIMIGLPTPGVREKTLGDADGDE